ncbi:leucine-rich repeat and immunoglobulin-like domain-containing nogo receptor-interacting protein 2 [Ptychodera flava]|uniref:leucine-rich repeat and immunoglobulin-like domain-containing nogo receptor-interacting protein 2 n=1 Tax=Ptychodera flava TaxID=63121 RepID=UPI00396A70B9
MHIADENMTCSTPEFSELVRWIDVEEGDAIELSCNATGVPEPDVYWITSSGDIVNSNKNINTTVVDDFELNSHGTLVITSTLMKHSGTYVCIAVNLKGKAACATHLRIIPKVTSSTVYNEMAIVANATIPISNLKSISEHESHVGIATGAFFGGLVLGVGVIIIILIAAVKRKRNSKEDARPEQKSKITIRFSDLKAVFKNRQYTEDSNGNSVSDTNITDTKNEGAAAALRDTRDRYVKPQEISDQLSRTQIYANVNVVETGDSTYASLSPDTRALNMCMKPSQNNTAFRSHNYCSFDVIYNNPINS